MWMGFGGGQTQVQRAANSLQLEEYGWLLHLNVTSAVEWGTITDPHRADAKIGWINVFPSLP